MVTISPIDRSSIISFNVFYNFYQNKEVSNGRLQKTSLKNFFVFTDPVIQSAS